MAIVSVHDARASLSHLIDRALGGEEIVITREGTPFARLEAVTGSKAEPPRKRRLGLLKGEFEIPDSCFFDPLPEEFLDAFYNGPIFPPDDDDDKEQKA